MVSFPALALGAMPDSNKIVIVYGQQMNVLLKINGYPEPVILHTYTFRSACTEAEALPSYDMSYVLVKRYCGEVELPGE